MVLNRDSLIKLIPPDFRLPISEVHVWRVSLDSLFFYHKNFIKTLTVNELALAERFDDEIHHRRFVVGRGFLRLILGCYLEINPGDVVIGYSGTGKPQLCDVGQGLRFNVSHSRQEAVYAFSQNREVGIDIEYIRAMDEADNIAERCFTAADLRLFRSAPARKRLQTFFQLWTRNQALIKARGQALAMVVNGSGRMSQAAVQAETGATPLRGGRRFIQGWSIQDLELSDAYAGALAAKDDDWQLRTLHLLVPQC